MYRSISIIAFSISLFSCTPAITIKQYANKNNLKLIKVNNISLFGADIKLSNARLKGEKNETIFLLYKDDTLKFISTARVIPKNEPDVFKFQKINDSVNILSQQRRRRYFDADTTLFCNNYCIRKICVHDFVGVENEKKILKLTFTIYHFDNANLVYRKMNVAPESFEKPESIISFFAKILEGSISIQPYAAVPYKSKDSAMLHFFSSNFY
jgi:hypothetical protein